MQKVFILILFISSVAVKCTNIHDDFHLYKNYLRDIAADEMKWKNEDFYRTPLQLYPGLFPKIQTLKYKKADLGTFRNHILNRELEFGSLKKRTSKAALSLMMQSKNADHIDPGHYCPYGK